MATMIRPEITQKSKYWISKHRHYELKHFCLQYHTWKKAYLELSGLRGRCDDDVYFRSSIPGDPTGKCVEMRSIYLERMDLVRRAAVAADPDLAEYIFRAVTEGLSYTYLRTKLAIPCGKDMYYDRYRRFFWLLSESRN